MTANLADRVEGLSGRGCETYKHGDVVLLLVNQGDYLMRQIWESEVAAALTKETPHAG